MASPKLKIKARKYNGETVVISMRISKGMLEDIDRVAALTGRTRNELLSTFIEFSLNNTEIDAPLDA